MEEQETSVTIQSTPPPEKPPEPLPESPPQQQPGINTQSGPFCNASEDAPGVVTMRMLYKTVLVCSLLASVITVACYHQFYALKHVITVSQLDMDVQNRFILTEAAKYNDPAKAKVYIDAQMAELYRILKNAPSNQIIIGSDVILSRNTPTFKPQLEPAK